MMNRSIRKTVFIFILLLFSTVNANTTNEQRLVERVIQLEVQTKQLEETIDTRSNILKEKQEIFTEKEKDLINLKKECDESKEKVDSQIKLMDEKFRTLYSKYDLGGIAAFFAILAAVISGIIYICRIFKKNLNNLEESYQDKIQSITNDAERKINAIQEEADRQIRMYQSSIDTLKGDIIQDLRTEFSIPPEETSTSSDNPF